MFLIPNWNILHFVPNPFSKSPNFRFDISIRISISSIRFLSILGLVLGLILPNPILEKGVPNPQY